MRSRTGTAFVIGTIIGLVAVVDAGLATARSPLERVELGEVNVISGDRIAGIPVHLPATATVPQEPFDNSNVDYDGKGRVLGVVLVKEGGPLRQAYQFVSTRWDFCGAPGCSGDWQTSLTHGMNWEGRHGYRLPAGDYRLYMIADGAPARVTLRLDGLSGHVEVNPTTRITGRIAIPTEVQSNPSANLFLGHGQPMLMPVHGLLIDGDAQEYGPGAATNGSCFWRAEEGEDQIERSIAGPHCLTFAERGGNGASFSTLGGGGFRSWGTGSVPPGNWKSSYWSVIAAPFATTDFVTLWLAYEDPSGP